MADLCDFRIEIPCPEPLARVIKESIEAALEEVEESAFGPILQSHHLTDYPAWDRKWSGIGGLDYENGVLRIGGSRKWDAPVWLGGYLSHRYRVPVVIHATIDHEEHEEWRINLHDLDNPKPILKWEAYIEEIRYPVRRYKYREGQPTSTSTVETEMEWEHLKKVETCNIRTLLPEDFLAGLPEARPEWLSGEGLDSTTVLARYFGSFEGRTTQEAGAIRPRLEYLVLGRLGSALLSIRQWGEDVALVAVDDDTLIHAHPPVARDTDWTPRTWGSIRAEWLAKNFGGRLSDTIRPDQNLLDGKGETTLAENDKTLLESA